MIGGKVIDSSALAAYARGSVAMDAWLAVAAQVGIVLYLPALAMAEVRAVHPDAEPYLAQLLDHPSVIHAELTRTEAGKVARLLAESSAWDGTAGHVILAARRRVLACADHRSRPTEPDRTRPGPGPAIGAPCAHAG